MTCKVYPCEGQLGNQGCLQGLLTTSKLKVIPPLLDQLPVRTALQSVSQTLGLNCSRTSFCWFTLEVIAGFSWLFFPSSNNWCVQRTGVIDCVHASRCERLARQIFWNVVLLFLYVYFYHHWRDGCSMSFTYFNHFHISEEICNCRADIFSGMWIVLVSET